VAEVHQDTASGAKTERPGLAGLLDSARAHRVDVVLVLKLDRFGRSTRELLNNIATLKSAGVRFIATTQGLDTDESNPVSHFLMTILGAVAQLEREFIRERVQAGMNHAKAKGVRLGRPTKIYNRPAIEEMRKMGWSIRKIAQKAEISTATVQRLLKPKRDKKPDCAESKCVAKKGTRRARRAVVKN
jgi:DNA invertase Pin-like site-specific DNA recombinase